jgi:hypothetical protein
MNEQGGTNLDTAEPKKDVETVALYQDIVDRAHKEVEHVRKVYYWFSGLITILLATGIGAGVYVTGKNTSEIRANMQAEADLMKAKATQEFAVLKSGLQSDLENKIGDVTEKVQIRIDDQFKKENVESMVREKAQERIDKVADPIIESKIDKKISPVIEVANKTLKAVEDDAAKMHGTVTQLELFSEFSITSTAAQNDDRVAFEQLRRWSMDKSYPLSSRAQLAVSTITDRLDTAFLIAEGPPIWDTGTDPAKLRLSDLEAKYESVSSHQAKTEIARYIEDREDISKKDKLEFFVKMLPKEQSTDAFDILFKLFERESGQKFKRFDTDSMLEWWNKNRENIR